jgi:hypothetical protein
MASIKDVKSKINQEEEVSKIKGVLSPYKNLAVYFEELVNVVNTLEEPKPVEAVKPKRSYNRKSTNNGETEIE